MTTSESLELVLLVDVRRRAWRGAEELAVAFAGARLCGGGGEETLAGRALGDLKRRLCSEEDGGESDLSRSMARGGGKGG